VGTGWALVGDASIHQDPWTGKGIDFASRHAIFLAEALVDALNGSDEVSAFDRYWRRRDEHGLETYHATNKLAKDLRQLSNE
jgi:flavin-dependent dehydrogenase